MNKVAEKENQPLVSAEEIVKIVKMNGIVAKGASGIIMSAFGINKLNDVYKKHSDKSGIDFVEAILEELGIHYEINAAELKRIPKTGAFIIVSNHPYGGIEGLILIKEISKIRSDFKAIGNFLFHKIEPIKEYIFPVNPFETLKEVKNSINGLKDALQHLSDGKGLLMFPAGEVSTIYPGNQGIADRKWMKQAVKFIKRASVPVVPIYFQGSNSMLFHSLGIIHPMLRTARIPSEQFNKKNKVIKIRVGNPISIAEQKEHTDIDSFGRYLRAKTYALGSSLEVKKFFKPANTVNVKQEEVIDAVDKTVLKAEVESLPDRCLLFKQSNFNVLCAEAKLLPNILTEIGRLRELTFREVGEGTNQKTDIDEFDLYYNHLFIWDEVSNSIAGAYRIGMGGEIVHSYGLKGFYLRSLFKMKKELKPMMGESLELGRSFIVKEFQRTPLPLFLLWKGILHFLIRNPDYRYLVGPVSISNSFSNVSKSMIVSFIMKNHYNEILANYVTPRKRFKPNLSNDDAVLTENAKSLKDIDLIIKDIESDHRIPILLKKYIELNGKIICFNIDPKFNDALDGLLVLDLHNVPEDTIRMLSKEMDSKILNDRFKNIVPNAMYYEYDSVPQF